MKEGQATWIVGDRRGGNIVYLKEALRKCDQVCLFFLVIRFGEPVLFPLFVLAVLDLDETILCGR